MALFSTRDLPTEPVWRRDEIVDGHWRESHERWRSDRGFLQAQQRVRS